MIAFYLAGRFARTDELLGIRDVIEALGGEVTSRWIHGDHKIDDSGKPDNDHTPSPEQLAQEDVEDVKRADVLIAFTEEPRSFASRGGRHVELGIALGLGKRIIVVGPRENVFCWLPDVEHYGSWSTASLTVTRMLMGGSLR